MNDENIVIPARRRAFGAEKKGFEPELETLVAIAEREGRDFLAYLLAMALVHVREGNEERRGRKNVGH
jgi:hypothetical protein